MSFSSPFFDFRFSLVLADEVTKMFIYIFESLACLALKLETIVKKIMQLKLPKMKTELTKICIEPGIHTSVEKMNSVRCLQKQSSG